METKLGNYIHYNFSNYQKYGITRNKGNNALSASQLFDQWKKDIYKRVVQNNRHLTPLELEYMEQQLNYFYGPSVTSFGSNTPGLTSKERQDLVNALLSEIRKSGQGLQNLQINYDNLSALQVNTIQKKGTPGEIKRQLLQGVHYTYVSAIEKRINALQHRLGQGLITDKTLEQQVRGLLSDYQIICQNNKALFQNAGKNTRFIYEDINVSGTSLFSMQDGKAFVDELNNLYAQTALGLNTAVTGLLGEYVSAIMPYAYEAKLNGTFQNLIKNDLSSLVKSNVRGGDRSAKVIDASAVLGASRGKGGDKYYKGAGGQLPKSWTKLGRWGEEIGFHYTQDKVDILYKMPLGLSTSPIRASVKNVGIGAKSISLVKGTSLVKYLQLYPYYGTHYLNYAANLGRPSHEKAPASDIKQAHQGMLLALGAHALAGGLYRIDKRGIITVGGGAQALIVNRRTSKGGHFSVYDIGALLDNLENALEFSHGLDLSQPKEWWNNWSYDYTIDVQRRPYQRCINILQQLHGVQLDVSLKVSHLKAQKT